MNKKRIVGVALAVGACGVLAAAGMMLSKKSGAVVLDQAGNEIAKLILQDGKISYECEDKYQSYADIVSQEAVKMMADIDKRRRTNYNFYTDQSWGKASNYTLCLNSSQIGYDRCEKIIVECVKQKFASCKVEKSMI